MTSNPAGTAGHRVRRSDLIVDTAGKQSLSHNRRALAPKGTLVVVGGEGGGRWFGRADHLLKAPLMSPFVSQTHGA